MTTVTRRAGFGGSPKAAEGRRVAERAVQEVMQLVLQKALVQQRLAEKRACKNKGKPKQINLMGPGRQGDKDGKDKDGKGKDGKGGFGDHSMD